MLLRTWPIRTFWKKYLKNGIFWLQTTKKLQSCLLFSPVILRETSHFPRNLYSYLDFSHKLQFCHPVLSLWSCILLQIHINMRAGSCNWNNSWNQVIKLRLEKVTKESLEILVTEVLQFILEEENKNSN